MAYTKRTTKKVIRKRRGRKTLKNRRKRSFQKVGRHLPLAPFMKRTLRYMETGLVLNPGVAGIAADYVFSANGIYDPNVTGTGHQPLGFDQLMTFYNKYTVIGSKIQIRFESIDTVYSHFVGCSLKSESTVILSGQQNIEQGETAWKYLSINTGSQMTALITRGFSAKKMFGKNVITEDILQGTSSANPTTQYYYHVWCDPNNGTDTGGCRMNVIIDYIVLFHDIKDLAQS